MSFLNTLDIATSALTAERFRMDIIAQNIAHMDTTRVEGPNGENLGPYRRRLTVFEEKQMNFRTALEREAYRLQGQTRELSADPNRALWRVKDAANTGGGVRVQQVFEDPSDFVPVYNPTHPDADADGYVMMPNVDRAEENVDLMAATRSYETNITVVNIIKTMAMKAAEITR